MANGNTSIFFNIAIYFEKGEIQLVCHKTTIVMSSIGSKQDCATTFVLGFATKKTSGKGNKPKDRKNIVRWDFHCQTVPKLAQKTVFPRNVSPSNLFRHRNN